MKKLAVVILVAIPLIGTAQRDPKNSVKINFSPTLSMAKNPGISYERKLSNSFSANLRLNPHYALENLLRLKTASKSDAMLHFLISP